MGAAAYSLELFVPDCEGKRIVEMQVPFERARLHPNWDVEEGGARWTVAGTVLLDPDEYYLAPRDQLDSVLAVVEASLEYRAHTEPVAGSRIRLGTKPVDAHQAQFTFDVIAGSGQVGSSRSVTGSIKQAAKSVLDGIEAIAARLDVLAKPSNERLYNGRSFLGDILDAAARIDGLRGQFPPKRPKPRHGR